MSGKCKAEFGPFKNMEDTQAVLYADVKYGLIDSVAVPPESARADLDDLRVFMFDEESAYDYHIFELLEDDIEGLNHAQELLENEYESLEVESSPTYEEVDDLLNSEKDYGRKKWMWGYGMAFFHQEKERLSLRER